MVVDTPAGTPSGISPGGSIGRRKRPFGFLARLRPRAASPVPWAALAGLLAAGIAISVSELIAGATNKTPSLVLGVSEAIVDSRFVPGAIIRWSIDTFGSAQKPLLFYGVLAATLVLGILTGIAARRWRWIGTAVFAVFGTLGGLAASANATATATWAGLSAGLAALAGAVILWWLLRMLTRAPATAAAGAVAERPHPYLNETGRRWFLTAAGATAVGALVASGVGRFLLGRHGNVEAGRADVADLLSQAGVRSDGGGAAAATPATTVAASGAGGNGATPTTTAGAGGGDSDAAATTNTTAGTSASGDTAASGGADGSATPTTAADGSGGADSGSATPSAGAGDGDAAAGGPVTADGNQAAPPTTQAPQADAQTPPTTAAAGGGQDTAAGGAPPVGDPGERAATTTTAAPPPPPPPPATTQAAAAAPPAQNSAGYYDNTVSGISPIVTPNSDFYRIDTALVVPSVDVNNWKLSITGMVDNPYTLTFRELIDMGLVEAPVTLSCVSNKVGGNLVDNAVWRGVPLADVLNRAGVQSGATQIVGRSVDNWNSGFPTELAFDGRTCLVAVAMNGEPLPRNHGFPARLVIAGLYGYVSATKWLEEIRLTTWEGFDSYWVPRGWAKRGPIKTQSRIDVPRGGTRVRAGRVAIAGIAWAPTRSIEKVEVQVDDGPWAVADLSRNMSINSWRQWVHPWDATPGTHRIRVRATDGRGRTQTSDIAPPAPDGATGWHTIQVTVT